MGTRAGRAASAAAAAGGVALVVAVWLPWFHRRLSSVFAPVRAVVDVSGWASLGTALSLVMLAVGAGAVAWAALAARRPRSGTWLVLPGGLALLAEVGTTVARVGVDSSGAAVTTTTPAAGIVLAYAGAAAVVLAGLAALLRQAAARGR